MNTARGLFVTGTDTKVGKTVVTIGNRIDMWDIPIALALPAVPVVGIH